MPQCWLLNSTAQAMALARVKPEVAVLALLSFSQRGSVTYLATRECFDLISGKGSPDIVADESVPVREGGTDGRLSSRGNQ